MKKIFFFLLFVAFISSCVPVKKLIYLQGNPVEKKEIHKINDAPYKLQVGDNISIDVKSDNEELVKAFLKSTSSSVVGLGSAGVSYAINRQGNIRMPTFGEINVLGYTTKEVRLKLEEEISKYLKDDEGYFVTVNLDGIKYTIMGEIGSPGPKVVYQNQLSIIDAITNSGDISTVGNRTNVEVLRITPLGAKKYNIDLTQIEALTSEIFFIKNNDYINVMPLRQKSWGTGTTGLSSLTTFVSIFTLITSTILITRGL
tara:strand:- start:5489 stop:6259 length:771 start_codon:yes stop_codon:yes gene_type:complete